MAGLSLLLHSPLMAQAQASEDAPRPTAAAEPVAAPPPASAATPDPATESAPTPGKITEVPDSLKRVIVSGERADDTAERRRSSAAKIIIGRDEIDKFGDSTVGELLKRLPGVTMQGPPGRGGAPRMRGLGGGYTQILIDGERVPSGFSLDSLSPEQIERVEILRAPTAETGARAIAGTINVITRGGFRKRLNEVRLATGIENDRLQPEVSWTRNDSLGPLTYNFSMSASRNERDSDSETRTAAEDIATGLPTLDQRLTSQSTERRQSLRANGRLQWRGEGGDTASLMPLLVYSEGTTRRSGQWVQSLGLPPPYDSTSSVTDGIFSLARLNAQWTQRLDSGGSVDLKAGGGQAHWRGDTLRRDLSANSDLLRTQQDSTDSIDNSVTFSGKLSHTLDSDHNLVAGAEFEGNRRTERRVTLENGQLLLSDFGENLTASSTRLALYAQDEWTVSPKWSAHAGLRWEGIATRGSGESGTADEAEAKNRSSVLTPLLHALWKPDPKSRDQVRVSLTRSYRSPNVQNLIARPSINAQYPAPGGNTPTQPDRAGNPALKPELATGIDVALERYLAGSGVLSANLFVRRISDLMRSVTALETVSWATERRWVSRMQNVGDALTQGVELEAKFRLSDVIGGPAGSLDNAVRNTAANAAREGITNGVTNTAANASSRETTSAIPKVDIRVNASLFKSKVQGVPGPDNRLDQQPSGTLNLGADYRVPSWPLTVGGNFNWTPGYTTRLNDEQSSVQGLKRVIDVYALWVLSPTAQIRVTASNVDPRDSISGTTLEALGIRETSQTVAPSYLNGQIRLELKL